jgi:hypothetical protein
MLFAELSGHWRLCNFGTHMDGKHNKPAKPSCAKSERKRLRVKQFALTADVAYPAPDGSSPFRTKLAQTAGAVTKGETLGASRFL